MKITTDFECGGGKRLTQLEGNHWRVEANGDPSGYNKYFCVRIEAGPDEAPATLALDVHPDADLGSDGAAFFASHFPSNVWCATEDWTLWHPLRNQWEDSVAFHGDHIAIRIPVTPGMKLVLATNPPLRYSNLMAWAEAQHARHGARLEVGSLGLSADGREIPLLRLPGARPGLPRLVVLAGQHPSEHCGNWACQGIVEYALSAISEAREISDNFDVAVVPMINPDGNVRGLSGANAEGVNMFSDFREASPQATESRRLWDWLTQSFTPRVLLHFHGFMGWKVFSQPPYDGVYVLEQAAALYEPRGLAAAYQAIQDRLLFETPGGTATWRNGLLGDESLEHHLAAQFGTLSAFYEINSASVAPIEQFRRGPQVLSAVVRALTRDVRLP